MRIFLLGFCYRGFLLGFGMFLLGRWRQGKCFVGLARLIVLFGFVGLAQFAAWLSQFFCVMSGGRGKCFVGLVGVVCLARVIIF